MKKRRDGGEGQKPSSLGHSESVQSCGSSSPTLMTSETSCDGVTAVDSSFSTAGGVGELREVRSSLVVQTVHPVLID